MPTKPAGRAMRGVVGSVAVLAAAALSLTACSSSDQATSSDNAAAAPVASSGSTASSAGSGSSVAPDSAGNGSSVASSDGKNSSSDGTISTKSAGTGCASSQLKVTRTNADAAAGSAYWILAFTNTSGTSCTLTGYPGLSYVAAAGAQSGNAARRDGAKYGPVTLKPGATAGARVRDANGQSGYDSATCKLASVQGLRIYPPNQKAALFLPWKTTHCAGSAVHALTVGPVQLNAHW